MNTQEQQYKLNIIMAEQVLNHYMKRFDGFCITLKSIHSSSITKFLSFIKKNAKHEQDNIVFAGSEIMRWVNQISKAPIEERDHVFLNRMGNPLSRFGIWDIVTKYKTKAALRMPSLKSKKVTPHTLRHTTAMHLLQSGVEINVIRSWLGHAQLITTHRYAEIDLAMKRKALKSCEVKNRRNSHSHWHSDPDVLGWLESL